MILAVRIGSLLRRAWKPLLALLKTLSQRRVEQQQAGQGWNSKAQTQSPKPSKRGSLLFQQSSALELKLQQEAQPEGLALQVLVIREAWAQLQGKTQHLAGQGSYRVNGDKNMIRLEILVLSIGKMNGSFDDPESKAFKLRNPLLLKTYRPEKKVDSENYRIFSSLMGGFKAGIADIQAKASGKNHRLSAENNLKDLLVMYGFTTDVVTKKVILFMRRALNDENISTSTRIGWFLEAPEAALAEQGE
jgi:hypothetical protein